MTNYNSETSWLIQYLHRRNSKKLIRGLVRKGMRVLDIGSGFGFLKPLVLLQGGSYFGVEPQSCPLNFAKRKYGSKGFYHGYFPEAVPLNRKDLKNALIISLTTIDEIVDKNKFLSDIRNLCSSDTLVYLSAPNADWFFFRRKELMTIDGEIVIDYGVDHYINLFKAHGFDVIRYEKCPRPRLIGLNKNGLKTFCIKILDLFLTNSNCYMTGYLMKTTNYD